MPSVETFIIHPPSGEIISVFLNRNTEASKPQGPRERVGIFVNITKEKEKRFKDYDNHVKTLREPVFVC